MRHDLLLPGDRAHYGDRLLTVGAVGWLSGERYYWLLDKHGVVTMVPAICVRRRNDATP